MMQKQGDECLTYIVGGRLGDFIYAMYVVKAKCKETGKKGRVFLSERKEWLCEPMARSLEETYAELKPLVMHQEYIHDFEIYTGSEVDKFDYNLNLWRKYHGQVEWLTMLQQVYELRDTDRGPWIVCPPSEIKTLSVPLVHRSLRRANASFPWRRLVSHMQCVFLTSDTEEYTGFPGKDLIGCALCKDLSEMVGCIDRCTFFVGNQSAPLAIAAALGKPFLAVLCNAPITTDTVMYMHRQKDINEFWYLDTENMYIPKELSVLATRVVRLEVSIGEALDKLSILKLKAGTLKNNEHVQNEILAIEPTLTPFVSSCPKLYSILGYVNKRLWDFCEWSRNGVLEPNDPCIMKENDARFRVKNKLNEVCRSYIREQKSYKQRGVTATVGSVCVKTEGLLRYLATYHDVVWLEVACDDAGELVKALADDPGIVVVDGGRAAVVGVVAEEFVVGEYVMRRRGGGKPLDVPEAFFNALTDGRGRERP
jgi:hypothetical protein